MLKSHHRFHNDFFFSSVIPVAQTEAHERIQCIGIP